ncbi:SDR family oxidoreductase [Rhodospirillaceae bacterium KN72]|uniref:SDR family oxidoreductase n=1 Tax=Pacificispira spongiicola TaxID=2729598 RepID=A0A7Y0DYF6_9PROT|nr:SDR family oxidoreductase [Pacificispira spongiicola]NMM43890.1 SDR family oxidoreductase [Pacificispira spongiicola]
MELRLDGKRALVTGASSGFGRHFAWTLARAGADIVLAARREDRLTEEAEKIAAETGRRTLPVALDIADTESIEECVAAADSALGGIDLLVNNAGTVIVKPSLSQTEEDWDAVLDVNLKGAFFMAKACAKRMSAQKSGTIVNISSLLADRVSKTEISYCVSKAGLSHMTRALAYEWAKYGIRVNAIAPGYIVTDLNRAFLESDAGREMMREIPIRRFGKPEDLDGALLYLSTDASAWMTGQIMTVDGGHSLVTP